MINKGEAGFRHIYRRGQVMFDTEIKDIVSRPKKSPSKWHFIIKPKLNKSLAKAKAEMIDDLLEGDILRERIK